jgi:septal ring factor EnvC (AmiA/AmiB activator)
MMRRAAASQMMPAMSAPSDQAPDPYGGDAYAATDSSPPPTPEHRRPWAWIAVCGVLAMALVGLTIWALNLNSDLDQQRHATAQAQQEADEANQQADQLSSDLDELGQSVSDAGDDLAQAGSDATQATQNALAEIKNKLSSLAEQVKPAATGSQSTDASEKADGAEAKDATTPVQTATP